MESLVWNFRWIEEIFEKFVGVGGLYTTGAAGLLLPKDVVAATSMADFGHETVQSIANGQILARNMKSVFQQQMDMILMLTAMPVG